MSCSTASRPRDCSFTRPITSSFSLGAPGRARSSPVPSSLSCPGAQHGEHAGVLVKPRSLRARPELRPAEEPRDRKPPEVLAQVGALQAADAVEGVPPTDAGDVERSGCRHLPRGCLIGEHALQILARAERIANTEEHPLAFGDRSRDGEGPVLGVEGEQLPRAAVTRHTGLTRRTACVTPTVARRSPSSITPATAAEDAASPEKTDTSPTLPSSEAPPPTTATPGSRRWRPRHSGSGSRW